MNQQEQRIAIAEACGWRPGEDDRMRDGTYRWDVRRDGVIFGSKPLTYLDSDEFCGSYLCDQKVPDYPNDLNAMREAWSMLPKLPMVGREVSNEEIALRQLAMVVAPKYAPDWPHCDSYCIRAVLAIANATASQYAEAFLRTIGKWRDE